MKELRVEGVFYLDVNENETEEQAIERFRALTKNINITETDVIDFSLNEY